LTSIIQDLYQYWKPGMVPVVPGGAASAPASAQ